MTGFKLQISGVGSNGPTNCATATARCLPIVSIAHILLFAATAGKRFLALVLQEYEALEKNKTLMTFPVVAANATNMFLFPCHSSIYLSPSIAHMASVTRFGKISLLW